MMDTNGIPSIPSNFLPSQGVWATKAGQDELLQLSGPTQVGVSTLISTMLAMQEEEQVVAISTAGRKVACAPSATWRGPIQGELNADSSNRKVTLKPKAGQEGRTLEWEVLGAWPGDFHPATKAAILALLDPVTPKYTVGVLSQKIAGDLPEGAECHILVDQNSGTVEVYQYANGTASGELDLADITQGTGTVVALTEPSSDGGPSQLKFEGGPV